MLIKFYIHHLPRSNVDRNQEWKARPKKQFAQNI